MLLAFKRNLILYSFFGILLTGSIIAFVSIVPLAEKLKSSEQRNLAFAVKTRSMTVNEFIARATETAAQISSRTRIREVLEDYNFGKISRGELVDFSAPKLKDALVHSDDIKGMSRFDKEGNLLLQVETPVPEQYFFIPGHDVVQPVIHGPYLMEEHLYLVVSSPIFNRESERVGTDIYLFDTLGLEKIVRDYEGLGNTGEIILGTVSAGRTLQFFASRGQDRSSATPYLFPPGDTLIEQAILKAANHQGDLLTITDGTSVASSAPLGVAEWAMVAVMDTQELYDSINRHVTVISIAIVLFLLSSIIILLLLLRPLANSVLVHADKIEGELAEKKAALVQLARAERIRQLNEERMEALLNINQLTGADEREVISFALEEAVRLTGSEVGYLHFFDDELQQIRLTNWSSAVLKQCTAQKGNHYPLEKAGIWADSIRRKEAVIHNDYPNFPAKKGYPEGHFPVTRHMSVPILNGDRTVGVAGVGNKQEPYDESDVRQLSLFMNSMWGILKEKRADAEKAMLQSQLQQAQKMEVVGRFSGGIAHDFNNILTTVLGFSELLLISPPKDDAAFRDALQSIHDAGERGAALTKQLLAFSRKQLLDAKVVDLNEVVRDMSRMIDRIIGEDVEFSIRTSSSAVNIMADEGQLEQILMNMAVNARDAMPGGGKFIISIDEIIHDGLVSELEGLKPGAYAVLSLADSGVGMTPEVKGRAFEPFFTTKEPGKGTGLGLATIFGIVRQHQGYITVYSEPGKGTTFKIYLPRTDDQIPEIETSDEVFDTLGTETILVVDDYAAIRDLIRETLQPLGYTILEASSGRDALEIFMNAPADIDLVLTDVIMPGMKGPELVTSIREYSPGMKIIYMSGYTDDFIQAHSTLPEGIDFINKPIIPRNLKVTVRKALDR